jgi:hypothetical protein
MAKLSHSDQLLGVLPHLIVDSEELEMAAHLPQTQTDHVQ